MKNNIPTITADPELRELILPSEKLVLGINGDVEVNAVQFQLPLTYRELELKKLTPRINYVNPNGDVNYYESTMESDESNCYFIWPITPDITAYTGHVRFSLTLYQTEGDNILHKFNTRSATGRVYTGFEVETQVTPEQQQTLLSKLETQIKSDLNDHTERLKAQLTEKGKETLDGFGESGSAVEELKTIKQDLGTKLTAPPTPEVGKILRVKSVNEDGTFTCEWADGGSNLDVWVDGESIVQDGVAEIPIAKNQRLGLTQPSSRHRISQRTPDNLSSGYATQYISNSSLDAAVEAAMCDGKGAAWTAEEQAAARERMGIDEWEDVITYTTSDEEENSTTCYIDFEHTYRKIYVLIDESAIKGTTYMHVRFGIIGKNKLHNMSLTTNTDTNTGFRSNAKYKSFLAEVVNTQGISYKYMVASGIQLLSYTESPSIGRVGSPSVSDVDVSAIGGLMWFGTMYAGTVIKVIGVRA